MEGLDLLLVLLPLAAFAAVVALLLLCWPRAPSTFLNRDRQCAEVIDVITLSPDSKRIRLSLGSKTTVLGLPVGKHILVYAPNPASCRSSGKWNGEEDPDHSRQEVERKYTPVTGDECPGYFDLVVKVYRPGDVRLPDGSKKTWEDGGKVSLFLDSKKPGDLLEFRGPFGAFEYLGGGLFKTPGRTLSANKVGMVAGGSGITPMLQLLRAALRDPGDRVRFRLLYANKTEEDILCREVLEELEESSRGRLQVSYTLDLPPPGWKQRKGFVTEEMLKDCLPAPSDSSLVLLCGPPAMVERACKPSLLSLGYPAGSILAF